MPKLKSVTDYLLGKKSRSTKPSMADLAKQFVNGELREDIESEFSELKISDKEMSTMTQLPMGVTDNKEFVEECRKLLQPLGYECEESHDGAGMYATLYVSAKLPKRKFTVEIEE